MDDAGCEGWTRRGKVGEWGVAKDIMAFAMTQS